jgi:hypothetical protein
MYFLLWNFGLSLCKIENEDKIQILLSTLRNQINFKCSSSALHEETNFVLDMTDPKLKSKIFDCKWLIAQLSDSSNYSNSSPYKLWRVRKLNRIESISLKLYRTLPGLRYSTYNKGSCDPYLILGGTLESCAQ